MIFIRDGELQLIKGSKSPVGGSDLYTKFSYQEHELEMKQGDCFYIFSDGIQDQFGGPGEEKPGLGK